MTPPCGLDAILATFGDPHVPDFEAKNIIGFSLPYPLLYGTAIVTKSRAHRLVVPAFVVAFNLIREHGLVDHAAHYSGIYAQRPIRGYSTRFPSTHSWGIAIDMNAEENPLGGPSRQDPEVVQCFKDAGFIWGGDFQSRKDPMHFQYARGY